MAQDRNGRDHKASGRPDGGQYEGKAGQGSDDDLVEVPTTADSVAPDEGWWASLENDPEATVGPEVGEEPRGGQADCRQEREVGRQAMVGHGGEQGP